MFFEHNYIKKAFSAILLVILLLIHSIKLLHTHSNNNSFSNHICCDNCFEKNNGSDLGQSSSDCSICSYQLGKDTDDLTYASGLAPATEHDIFNSFLPSFHKFTFHIAFENRGPPSII